MVNLHPINTHIARSYTKYIYISLTLNPKLTLTLRLNLYSPKFGSDTETIQHRHKYKQNTKYNDQVHHIIILHQTGERIVTIDFDVNSPSVNHPRVNQSDVTESMVTIQHDIMR